ncbi:MAG: TonB-dependent receptor, partial [Cyclobacteriaceae bacterium]|nr:TonB-dependent receptor [Cyclobacteriaceae bacterium]
GIAKTFNKSYELSIEGYYKEMDNLIEYKDGASFTSVNKDWQDKIETGSGTSYGAEVFLQKKLGKITGWVGYTLSWSNRQFDNINFGKEFPYRYDRRHDVSITSIYKINDRVELAAVWVYGTGNAVSLPTNTYLKNPEPSDSYNNNVDYYEGRNGFRMNAYHRLDFNIAWTKVKKNGIRKFTLGFYNMYNRRNPFFIQADFDYQTQQNKFVQYSLLPIVPSVSYRFDF